LLLNWGANIEAQNHVRETVLMRAVRANQNELVELLLHSGAKVNAKNSFWESSLNIACRAGNLELCTLLLGSGAEFPTNAQRIWLGNKVNIFLSRMEKAASLNGKEIPYKSPTLRKRKIEKLFDSNRRYEKAYVVFRNIDLS
jgi:ankyrin repeat protein